MIGGGSGRTHSRPRRYEPITPEFVLRLGWAAGRVFAREGAPHPHRQGHSHLRLHAGVGARSGSVCGRRRRSTDRSTPTPAIAYLTRTFRCDAGVVISPRTIPTTTTASSSSRRTATSSTTHRRRHRGAAPRPSDRGLLGARQGARSRTPPAVHRILRHRGSRLPPPACASCSTARTARPITSRRPCSASSAPHHRDGRARRTASTSTRA